MTTRSTARVLAPLRLLAQLADQGIGMLLISSDLPEVLGMCQRILVMREGRIAGCFDRAEASEERLGAQKAIADAGRSNQIVLFGFDGQKAAIEQIARGTNYAGSGQNSPSVIARIGFEKMMTLLAGGQVPKDTITPVVVITRENAASLLDPNSVF